MECVGKSPNGPAFSSFLGVPCTSDLGQIASYSEFTWLVSEMVIEVLNWQSCEY